VNKEGTQILDDLAIRQRFLLLHEKLSLDILDLCQLLSILSGGASVLRLQFIVLLAK
jgi:hypothetical protein